MKVVISKLAKQDLEEIKEWYKHIEKKLALQFLNDFKTKTASIISNPYTYAIRFENIRLAMLNTFPYMIYFYFNNDNIIISRILHTSRNPDTFLNN